MGTTKGVFQRASDKFSPVRLLILVSCLVTISVTAALVYVFTGIQFALIIDDECSHKYGPVVGMTLMLRHGERTIDIQLPNDPYRDNKYWPEGMGELTKNGIIQHYLQGQWITSRYKQLFPREFFNIRKAIHVVSTDYNRTIMSAGAALAGMFKIHDNVDSWRGLRSHLLPIHSIPKDRDALLQVTKTCPRMAALLLMNIQTDRYQRVLRENQEIANILAYNLGVNITLIYNYQEIYRVFLIEQVRGLKFGRWADAVYPNPLKELSTISYAVPTWTTELKRLRGGPFIKEMIDNIRRKADDPNFRSVSIYSAHDTSIAAFLNSLNDMFQKEKLGPPPFAALVIVEHRRKSSIDYVRILYRCPFSEEDSPDCNTEPRVLTIPGCEAVCPLEKMANVLHDVVPEDWEAECKQI